LGHPVDLSLPTNQLRNILYVCYGHYITYLLTYLLIYLLSYCTYNLHFGPECIMAA